MKLIFRQRTRIIFVSITIILILSASFSYYFSGFREDLFHEYMMDISRPLSSEIISDIKQNMMDNQNCKITLTPKDITKNSSLQNIYIMNNRGKIISSSDSTLIDSVIQNIPTLQNNVSNKDNINFHSTYRDNITIYSSIKNSDQCMSCHSNFKENLGYVGIVFNFKSQKKLDHALLLYDFLSIGFIFLAFFIVIVFFHHKYFQEPYNTITSGIREIEKGNLKTKIQIDQKCEMKKLAASINSMTKKLDNAQVELKLIHKREIDRVGQLALVGELAASVAHEIKNPISGIRNALDIILDQNQELQEKDIFIEMQVQAQRVFKTINDLMCFAKPKQPVYKKINIHDILNESITLYELQIQKKGIELFKDYDVDVPSIYGDADLLKTVFTNILVNAYHACPENNGKIYIETRLDMTTQQVHIIFYNNGKVIPDENLKLIFEPFFTTKAKGTGLGLSLSKSIIEKHNGQIGARNAENIGTGFYIYLPIRVQSIVGEIL